MLAKYETKFLQVQKFVTAASKKSCFELGEIGNMDEVLLTSDVPSNKTVDIKGAQSIKIKTTGHEKTHYTVVLACCTDSIKLPPLLTSKIKMMFSDRIPQGIFIHVHAKGQ
jgi:hypothetical protein